MGKRTRNKPGKPDPFQYLEVRASPAENAAVIAALVQFVDTFVTKAKRERAKLFLLDTCKRERAIRELSAWLDAGMTEELEGATGFPQNLKKALGELQGIFVDSKQAVHVTIAQAAVLGHDSALFVSDDGRTAIVFAEVGAPILCQVRRRT